jgi:Fur family transcriptional regulator, ferric uptake regulator
MRFAKSWLTRHEPERKGLQTTMADEGAEAGETTAQTSRIERLCIEKGMRMTGQRRVIAGVLSDASDHPDVFELHRRVAVIDPRISLSTVYRNVKLLEAEGILARHAFGQGVGMGSRARYERAGIKHHDHLVDLDSGQVIEFRNEEIERLQELIAEELGFELVGHRLELYGVKRPSKR